MSIAGHVRRISPRSWFFLKVLRYKFYNGEPEIWLVRHCLANGKVAIDIGASVGLYSREMAKSAARVVAFEANPRVAEFARRVLPSNVQVESVALSSANGEMTLRIPINRRKNTVDDLATIEPTNGLDAAATTAQSVPARRLDDYGFLDCGFIKVDVEGHEEAVLQGGMGLIERERPILMIELCDRFNPGIVSRVSERLSVSGYSAYRFWGGRLRALADLDFLGDHVNINHNFVFVPDEARLPLLSRWDRFASTMRSKLGR